MPRYCNCRSAVLMFVLVFWATVLPAQSKTELARVRAELGRAKELPSRQTIAASAGLTAKQKASLMRLMMRQLRPYAKDSGVTSEEELRKIALRTRLELIDLNGDGVPEMVLQAFDVKEGCGGTGNCPLWIFERTAKGYRKLLDTRGKDRIGGVQRILVESSSTNGYRDIFTTAHDSAFEQSISFYRFRSPGYRDSECDDANWNDPKNFTLTLKKPIIKRESCGD